MSVPESTLEHPPSDSRLLQSDEPPSTLQATRNSTRPTTQSRPTNRVASGQTLRRHITMLLQPEKKLSSPPSSWKSLRAIILASWLNVLLVCIPISWALNFALPDQHTLIFVFSFLAIIPLAKLLAFATDELSMRVGQTLAGLMNATLGNAVELIVSIIALVKCELQIVQSSLVGSILSNLLLVLGMCFFAGGLRFSEQGFGHVAAQLNSSLLTISVIAVLLPGAFHMALQGSTSLSESDVDDRILRTSHGVAIILLFIYCSYLLFQLFSHKNLYSDHAMEASKKYTGGNPFKLNHRLRHKRRAANSVGLTDLPMVSSPRQEAIHIDDGDECSLPHDAHDDVEGGSHEEEETPQMTVPVSIGLLVAVTVLVAVTAEFLVDSINGLTSGGAISTEFVGVILLPIVGNAAEHVTAVTVSVKDKLTLSLGVAVGSSIQIALFVIPFTVTLGWILGKPLTLMFDPLESIVMFLAVLTVNYVVQDGKSNWLEGMLLMTLYLILCVTFWYYPGTPPILSC
ncbi:calcium proton exchanger [Pisolithus microcarpus]|nr:calcium proton exchanger [Pisolithus microcarpus]